jgi:SH3-like domain-containing protein
MVKVTLENLKIRSKPNIDAKVIAIAEVGALLNLERCDEKWCRLSYKNIKGWSAKKGFFGLIKDETP